jgi:para-aminobenzoate synthetase / 4-amino-4-deoxychorismate lyase
MKGTAPPGESTVLENAKNRAEHLMIVDLLRNDLHRVCSDVRVERLFEVERYPTFVTMTSTIGGDLPKGVSLETWLRATFPCGSVTGAPKRAAMRHIADLESSGRGFYTGSIGYLSPARRGWWNVAIRTLQIRGEHARFDAGGGIVSDSDPQDEWHEIAVKSQFLDDATKNFALIETFCAGPGGSDIEAHVRRLLQSADSFGMAADRQAIERAISAYRRPREPLLVRLTLDAGGPKTESRPFSAPEEPVTLCFADARVRSDDPFLRHKTSWRPAHDAATREANARGCFDGILRNERDEITEGGRTNIFVQIGNIFHTPPVAGGVLPGILRARLLAEGRAVERVLFAEDLTHADAIFAGNSARGLLRARITR